VVETVAFAGNDAGVDFPVNHAPSGPSVAARSWKRQLETRRSQAQRSVLVASTNSFTKEAGGTPFSSARRLSREGGQGRLPRFQPGASARADPGRRTQAVRACQSLIARSASSRVSKPTRRPSDVVTGRLLNFCSRIRITIASRRALGLTVLGPGVMACSAETFARPRIARRPIRPRTTRRSSTTKQVSQPLWSSCPQISSRRSSRRQVGTSVRT